MTNTTQITETTGIAFAGDRCIATGPLSEIAAPIREAYERDPHADLRIFDVETSQRIEMDLRGSLDEVLRRLAPQIPAQQEPESPATGPGRPKLGVVAREVTLLPRHWEWLNSQPGGASVALRKLVEEARKSGEAQDRIREARDAAYRFLSYMGGDRPGFEEASRALFAGDRARFESLIASWPADIREHALRLTEPSFSGE